MAVDQNACFRKTSFFARRHKTIKILHKAKDADREGIGLDPQGRSKHRDSLALAGCAGHVRNKPLMMAWSTGVSKKVV